MSRVIKRAVHAGVAVAVFCGMAACALGPHRTDEQKAADKAIAERVEAALSTDKTLFARHVYVNADNGVVYLTGYVWDRPDLEQTIFIAEGVPGVKRVVNDLELQRNGDTGSPLAR